jgi:DNA-binding transcriptional ArsR family regulator
MPRRAGEGIELLADPTRRRIVGLIAGTVHYPADIASATGLSRSTVSHHLRVLVEVGILRWRRTPIDNRHRRYFIDPDMKGPVIAWLAGVDLRSVRQVWHPLWSRPQRIHRLRHDAREIKVGRDIRY